MADKTGIEWTDATWNPTTGCDRVSPGCDHCYALTLAKRLKAMGSSRYQLDGDPATSGPGFGFAMHPEALDQPIRWKRGRRIFVNSMSDLFHGGMSVEFLAKVWAVMSVTPRHTYQVLTKRPQIARHVLTKPVEVRGARLPFKMLVDAERLQLGYPVLPDSRRDDGTYAWPLPNVWLGTSVEDQKRADLRIGHLLDTPAAVRFLSMEPLLGPVNLSRHMDPERECNCMVPVMEGAGQHASNCPCLTQPEIGWVIAGGESGPGARPMHPDWVRKVRDQCELDRVPFHFKQWGEWAPTGADDLAAGRSDGWLHADGTPAYYAARHRPGVAHVVRVGKKTAGRELDGRTWDEWPR